MGGRTLEQAAKGGSGFSWISTCAACCWGPVLQGGWTQWSLEVTSSPYSSVIWLYGVFWNVVVVFFFFFHELCIISLDGKNKIMCVYVTLKQLSNVYIIQIEKLLLILSAEET